MKLLTTVILLLMSVCYVEAAITFDATTSGPLITTGNIYSSSFSHTVGTGSNRVLYVMVVGIGTTSTSVTYNSIALTKVASCGGWQCEIWRLVAPPSGTFQVVTSFGALYNGWESTQSSATSFAGVDQAAPEHAIGISPGLGAFESPITQSLTTTVDATWLLGEVVNHNGALTSATGQTLILHNGGGAAVCEMGYQGPMAPGSNSMAWTVVGGSGSVGAAVVAIKPYSVAVIIPPVISGVTVTANSPNSVKATWTTDIASDSQVSCGPTSGGLYPFASRVTDPNLNNWHVTAHSMASDPMPNGSYYCVVTSVSPSFGIAVSAESPVVVLPAVPPSLPITMVNPVIPLKSRLGDRYNGIRGAPATGVYSYTDSTYFVWADDGHDYMSGGQWPQSDGLGNVVWDIGQSWTPIQLTDARHVDWVTVTPTGPVYPNYLSHSFPDAPGLYWWNTTKLSLGGSIYQWMHKSDAATVIKSRLTRTDDHYQSFVMQGHNLGPDTNYLTSMICNASDGRITATSKLNLTDMVPFLTGGDKLSVIVKGASGTNVNGMFDVAVIATATTLSWINPGATCTGWSWSPTGGTGNGGGLILPNGELEVTPMKNIDPLLAVSFDPIQNDGPDYLMGTKAVGMDSQVYGFCFFQSSIFTLTLCRMRVEDFKQQDYSKVGFYIGHQNGDDGLYAAAWDYTHLVTPTPVNRDAFSTIINGKGAWVPQVLYLTDLHRFVVAEEISGATDSTAGGTLIFDGGPYPWSPYTLIGSAQRNPDVYWRIGSGPEFPQFVASSQTHANGVTSVSLSHNGGNFGGTGLRPITNEYDMYMNVDLQFVVKPPVAVAKPLLTVGEVTRGMDLAYDFDVPTGSFTMPNAAPSDAIQKWAWVTADKRNAVWNDPYGSILHSIPNHSAADGAYPSSWFQNIAFTTPYQQSLPGPLTVVDCFGHYPASLLQLPAPGAIALKKGTDLVVTWSGASASPATISGGVITAIPVGFGGSGFTSRPTITITGSYAASGATAVGTLTNGVLTAITVTNGGTGYRPEDTFVTIAEPTNNWNVSFLGTSVGNVPIPDNSIGCLVVRRDSSNRVSLYTSAGIGKSLPLTSPATATIAGPWTTSPLVIGDGMPSWGGLGNCGQGGCAVPLYGNSFLGIESLLRVWSRDLADDELISEMAAIRGVLWARGRGSAIP